MLAPYYELFRVFPRSARKRRRKKWWMALIVFFLSEVSDLAAFVTFFSLEINLTRREQLSAGVSGAGQTF